MRDTHAPNGTHGLDGTRRLRFASGRLIREMCRGLRRAVLDLIFRFPGHWDRTNEELASPHLITGHY